MDDEDELYNHPAWDAGLEVGHSLGYYEAYEEALAAFQAGEIMLWLAMNEPKSPEGWEKWEAENGPADEYVKRWKRKPTEGQ